MRSDTSQILLILSGLLVTALFGAFLYREIFPEYRIYQDDYLALEEFRSTYTEQPIPPFKFGIKQIVLEREDKGPATVDRCTSCHVALQIPYFSPTKIAKDLNGNLVRDENGKPVLVPNEEYIWLQLDEKIAALRDEKVLEQLKKEGQTREIKRRLAEADKYAALKVAHVGHQTYDVTKVLAMHPLMGNETRPFEFHPIEEYGCTVCHNGNGKGLVTDKAHGPVFDGQYEVEFRGDIPQFTEKDPDNDPTFARVFNDKPGHDLLFQTEPLFVGALIQSKCMQCHQTSDKQLEGATSSAIDLTQKREKRFNVVFDAYEKEKQSLIDLLSLREQLQAKGYEQTIVELKAKQSNYILPAEVLEHAASQLNYLTQLAKSQPIQSLRDETINKRIDQSLLALLGSQALVEGAESAYRQNTTALEAFLKQHQGDPEAKGSLYVKAEMLDFNQDLLQHAKETQRSFESVTSDQKVLTALSSDVDELTRNYQRGKELYLSQACFACHRISGLARGGVGPELTRIGESYPWYIKESIVWPQADLKSSTMPNFRLDHQELEDLMTFLLAQKGGNKAVAETSYQASLQAWEAGRKMPWEKPISPADMYDLNYAMTVFATQGCASCHRLQGFESNVGFQAEKENPSFDKLYEQQVWFKRLFPEVIRFSTYDEELPGSEIVAQIEKHVKDIDERIVANVRKDGILEEIDQNHPEAIEALYSNFRYASRAKNHYYEELIQNETDASKIEEYRVEHQAWKDRVHRVLMTYIQVYGFGRLIGPHLNWSGIYRSDEWLMEHFRNPSAHVPRSIMPVMPFDDTKFYALTHMLDKLGIRNRKHVRDIWALKGFDPQEAYEMHCAQCHGIGHQGYGVISEWIYPIPKNLKNPDFLRNLTKEEAIRSITHGVKGTPMAPWGEVAGDKPANLQEAISHTPVLTTSEIQYLVDWIYSSLPGGEVIRETEIPKWRYEPEDILNELKKEGGHLVPLPSKAEKERPNDEKKSDSTSSSPSPLTLLPTGEGYYAALKPEVYSKNVLKAEQAEYTVEDVFNVVPSNDKESPYHYYIKKKYYTPHNIQEGQAYFLLNCAVCHGNEGDGSGIRGQAMQDAKPRMLSNLDWIQSRDDLRLIRSIKYGVPGTSMTSWGDYTNSLQRMQLVMFIRTLSEERDRRIALDQAVYYAFDTTQVMLEEARVARSEQLNQAMRQEKELQQQQMQQASLVMQGKEVPQKATELYQQRLEVEQKIKQMKLEDQLLVDMKAEVKRERDLYYNLGVSLIAKNMSEAALENYNQLIRLQAGRYSFEKDELTLKKNGDSAQKSRELRKKIEQELDEKIDELEKEQQLLEGKMISAQRREELASNQADLDAFIKLKARLITDTEAAIRSIEKQHDILQDLKAASEFKEGIRK